MRGRSFGWACAKGWRVQAGPASKADSGSSPDILWARVRRRRAAGDPTKEAPSPAAVPLRCCRPASRDA
eukprot:2735529-Prymnesium_polylepis.2